MDKPRYQVRRRTSALVEIGYSDDQARAEAARCLDCGINTIFDGERCKPSATPARTPRTRQLRSHSLGQRLSS